MLLSVGGRAVHAGTGGRDFEPVSGKAVVLIHGSGMDNTVWAQQNRFLAHHGLPLLSVDLPGHGRSEGPALETVEEMADWVVALLDAAGLEAGLLAGHSLGSLVALAVAARAPERVAALALLGTAERMPVHPDLLALARAGDPEAIRLVVGWGFGRRAHVGGNALPGVWMLGSGLRLMEREAPGVLGTDLAACDRFASGAEMAAAVRCPVTLILGAADKMTPAKAGRALAARIADARVVELPETGHMMMVEAPAATARALLDAFSPAMAAAPGR